MTTAQLLLLPDVLMVLILSLLPAKSLLRCRLVCKAWWKLISSTEFKVTHLEKFNQLNPRYFYCGLEQLLVAEQLYDVQFDNEACTFVDASEIEFSFGMELGCRIIGSCNGVFVLCDPYAYGGGFFNSHYIILWNPSIRRILSLSLPNFNSSELEESDVVLGFGYEKISDDYKVVRLAYTNRPRAEVYAVKTGIWREVVFPDDLRCFHIQPNWTQIFSNGSVHWLASDSNLSRNSILTFNITTDRFGEIPLPVDLVKEDLWTVHISVVGEWLAVTCEKFLTDGLGVSSCTYKIWVMKEYMNPTSWTLIHDMHYPNIYDEKPLKLLHKRHTVILAGGSIFVHNYGGHASCICPGYHFVYARYVDKYQQSLALLDVGHSDSDEEAMKALRMIREKDVGKLLELRNKGDMTMESRDGNMIIHNYNGCAPCICTGYESKMDCRTYVDQYQESLTLLDVGHNVLNEEAINALMRIERQGIRLRTLFIAWWM